MGSVAISGDAQGKAGVPHVGARVRQVGNDNVYVVLRVDVERRLADLLLLTGTRRLEENVPFECLRELGQHGPVPVANA